MTRETEGLKASRLGGGPTNYNALRGFAFNPYDPPLFRQM
jgi:hypothetical protein